MKNKAFNCIFLKMKIIFANYFFEPYCGNFKPLFLFIVIGNTGLNIIDYSIMSVRHGKRFQIAKVKIIV